jgi:hypothetical protein
MRTFCLPWLVLMLVAVVLRAEPTSEVAPYRYDGFDGVPAPLAAALRDFGRDAQRWAYTQHVVQFDRRDAEKSVWTARYDPSQHPDEQWTLLERDHEEATAAQQRRFRREQAKRERNRRTLGELLDLPQATLARETDTTLVYEVPLRREPGSRLPPEKFEVLITLVRAGPALTRIELRPRERFRVGLVVNVKGGEARLDFSPVLPDAGPAVTAITARGAATVMMVPVGGRVEITRTDLRRVRPYDERFNVEWGPLKAIDF